MKASRPARWLRNLVPSRYSRSPNDSLETFGIACLLLVVFLMPWARDGARVFEVLLVLVTLLSAREILRHDRDGWIYLVFAAFVGWMLWINQVSERAFPEWDSDRAEDVRDGARMFLFLVYGWWLGGSVRGMRLVACLAIAGVVVAVALDLVGLGLNDTNPKSTNDFGFRNSQHTAVVFGTLLLAVITLGPRHVWASGPGGAASHGRMLGWLVAIVGLLWMLAQTGNRQILLGLAAGLGTAAVLWVIQARARNRDRQEQQRISVTAWIAALLLVAGLVWSAVPAWERMEREWTSVSAYMSGTTDQVEWKSVTVRLALWRYAADRISERPVLGHGGASRPHVIAESDLPQQIKDRFGHFHNSYVDLALAFGVLAPVMLVSILAGLAIRLLRAWACGTVPTDAAAFLVGWLALFSVVNVFESYVYYNTGPMLLGLVGAIAYAATIRIRHGDEWNQAESM